MEEHRITSPGPLLKDGSLTEPGYATSLLLHYHRSAIKAPKWRIKEWDYYLINDNEYAVALTLGDLGYIGLVSASIMDFEATSYKTTSVIVPLPLGRFNLPSTSEEGVSEFSNNRVQIRFEACGGVRRVRVNFKRFENDETLAVDAILDEEPQDSMVIATPWKENPQAFYYNQKIIGMRVKGSFRKGILVHGFQEETSFGLLDWGRGVWTYDNTWYWGVAQGWQDGEGNSTPGTHRFGLNIGYGFGDTSAASENMVFLDGVAHKFGVLVFGIPEKSKEHAEQTIKKKKTSVGDRYRLMEPWHITDTEGKVDLIFTPEIDRIDYMNYGVIVSDQHQVFGTFSGAVDLDGRIFKVEGLKGSAEVIHNKY